MNTLRIVLLVSSLLLTACGGGDPEPDDRATIEPVPCLERPELCR